MKSKKGQNSKQNLLLGMQVREAVKLVSIYPAARGMPPGLHKKDLRCAPIDYVRRVNGGRVLYTPNIQGKTLANQSEIKMKLQWLKVLRFRQ